MDRIVCFGEILLRLSPVNFEKFIQTNEFKIIYGGSEANVAVSLACFGKNASFVTKLPNNDIGQAAINDLRRYGVDTDYIRRGGSRIGIYYCEKGADPRPLKVIYDRAHSAISEAERYDFNWEKIMDNARWFHFSGITPAIGDNTTKITMDAILAAKKAGATISVDLNYRKKLWKPEKAKKVMMELVKHCDVVIGAIDDMENVFGMEIDSEDEKDLKSAAKKLLSEFNLKCIAIPLRKSINTSEVKWSAELYDGVNFYKSKNYVSKVVDKIGAGDAFGAGIIYGLTSGYDMQKTLEFAAAASCLKHTVIGDVNLVTVSEVEQLMTSTSTDKLER